MEHFDLVILGSGPAGYAAAMRAIDFKKHVCIVEAGHVGGAGVMHGALTSKTMYELSHDYDLAASVNRGFRASGLTVDYDKVLKTIIHAAKVKQFQIRSQIETFSKDRSLNGSITMKYGYGTFIDNSTIRIKGKDSEEIIKGDNIIIATGSRPKKYPGIEVDQERIINSEGILNLKKFPEKMIIIGSGIIGCEYANFFSCFKQTEVHLIDRTHRVIPYEDDDVGDFVSKNLEKSGVIIHYTANLRSIRKKEDCLEVILDYLDGHSKVLEVDVALVAIGRQPNTDTIGLENTDATVNEYGYLKVDKDLCALQGKNGTGGIYAAGDITGAGQFFSVAELQGRHAVKSIANEIDYPLVYANMSTLMFFKPVVATVGMNEKMLQRQNIPYKMVWYSNELVNRAIAMQSTDGFIKVLLSDDGEDRILGMRAAGPQASAFIASIAHYINQGNSIKEVMNIIHPHPSITEGIQETLRVFKSESIYKPEAFPDLIKTKSWRPQ